MIIYHPYKDANHCAYRLLSILIGCKTPVSLNYLHIADFYYLFPCQLKNIERWPRAGTNLAKHIDGIEDSYEHFENPRRTFFELKTIRRNVIIYLLSKGLLEYTDNDLIKVKVSNIPKAMIELLESDVFRTSIEFTAITQNMKGLKMYGESGLKSKSGFMEYRYDVPKVKA
ncbi:ABC-three component system middle component 5 [Vibrio splendidus]|mgnify:CR=1 FL=1|uniref:ABC-three component system middle component 5 n=1 Tax=Vibrio splendidus TaxID=29497 RepID=UPI00148DB5EE|nr:ABC-three component system middle component 5 [Vibrio splendidus]NOJ10309.1 hypothetical protein [Vibrio splendidus]